MSTSPKRTGLIAKPTKKTVRISVAPTDRASKVQVSHGEVEEATPTVVHYYVFADDRQIYGPAPLSLLREWVGQGLVAGETWIFEESSDSWKKGRQIKEVRHLFSAPTTTPQTSSVDMQVGQLRRLRLFSDMDDHQIEEFSGYLKKVQFAPLKHVLRRGDHNNSMYILFLGEASVCTRVDGHEKILNHLRVGDFFGETSILEEGIFHFDVKCMTDCIFLRLTHDHFQSIAQKHTDLSSRFLAAVVRHISFLNQHTQAQFVQAKAMVRGSLGKTGQIMLPPVAHNKRL